MSVPGLSSQQAGTGVVSGPGSQSGSRQPETVPDQESMTIWLLAVIHAMSCWTWRSVRWPFGCL